MYAFCQSRVGRKNRGDERQSVTAARRSGLSTTPDLPEEALNDGNGSAAEVHLGTGFGHEPTFSNAALNDRFPSRWTDSVSS